MKMNRKIIVIGSPGSGKSTFARKLHAKTGIPLFHLDLLYHRPDRTVVSREAFDAKLRILMAQSEWIIDGNYLRTLPVRLMHCNEVFLFCLPVECCLEGARARLGRSRPDMPWAETELDPEFAERIRKFPGEQLPVIEQLLDGCRDSRRITVFHSRAEADALLAGTAQRDP